MAMPTVVRLLCPAVVWLAACGEAAVPQKPAAAADPFEARRARMIEVQLRGRDIRDERVLDAMRRVPRHLFVPPELADRAYDDRPLPIGQGQTISQPYIVAYMTEAAEIAPADRVLEIGTGSGYQAAVLAVLAREVWTIEILPELAERARATLERLGHRNVHVRAGNGWEGWPDRAPFDAILVTAAPDEIPRALVDQLAVGGRLVVPVGEGVQEMTLVTRTPAGVVEKRTIPVRFVPMTGKPRP
jgi:protein-L-isoaspartate(D-aspartate) O-methyltransferase